MIPSEAKGHSFRTAGMCVCACVCVSLHVGPLCGLMGPPLASQPVSVPNPPSSWLLPGPGGGQVRLSLRRGDVRGGRSWHSTSISRGLPSLEEEVRLP